MKETRFTVNAVVLIAIIFSAMGLFFTVNLPHMADSEAFNDFFAIEGTELSVKYSNREPNGLYTGTRLSGTLRLEGDFGYDWGAAAEGNALYINEYVNTAMDMMLVKLDRIDLETYEKETLLRDAILRGRCASGELVVMTGFMMPSTFPETNSLVSLYSFASEDIRHDGGQEVVFIDPGTGEIVYSMVLGPGAGEKFEMLCVEKTLDEIKKGGV